MTSWSNPILHDSRLSYSDADSIEGYPHWGRLGLYAGGGYLVPLRGPKADLITLLNTLEQEDWIDRYTRAVFVEFTTYNAQVQLQFQLRMAS